MDCGYNKLQSDILTDKEIINDEDNVMFIKNGASLPSKNEG